jgi:hypothetical protein
MRKKFEFINDAGGCIVSNNILNGNGRVKWCIREQSVDKVDNGWRFLSEIDTDEFLDNPLNMSVCDFNTIAKIEPAILAIYNMPIGTELTLEIKDGGKYFVNSLTGKVVNI